VKEYDRVSRTPSNLGTLDQAWLTRGGAFVLANIRGGGEYGPQGHEVIHFENQEGGHGGGANLNQLGRTNAMQVVYLMQQLMD